jgi:2-oxoglutarate ferredoxin oxidoreductase subunit alpha
MNLGQLGMLLRAKFLVDVISVTQIRGMPFRASELAEMLTGVLTPADARPAHLSIGGSQ